MCVGVGVCLTGVGGSGGGGGGRGNCRLLLSEEVVGYSIREATVIGCGGRRHLRDDVDAEVLVVGWRDGRWLVRRMLLGRIK